MIEEILAAAAIGMSLGNAWVCALISLGVSVDSKKGGMAFIAGRFIGLMLLGGAIAGLGLVGSLNPTLFIVLFGVLTIGLGTLILLQVLTRRSWMKHGRPMLKPLHRRAHHGAHPSDALPDGGEVGLETDSKSKATYVFSLGIVRGATPCVKTMVLAPLLISVDFWSAMVLVLVFAVASTVYPVIGFLSGNILRQSRRYNFYVKVGSALMMIVIGAYFVVNAFTSTHGGDSG